MPKGIFLQLDVDYASSKDLAVLRRFGRDTAAVRDFLVQCWCYCKRHMSDGHVPLEEIGLMVYPDTPKTAERRAACLVEVGIAVRTEDGYFFPDYLKRNKSRAEIGEESARKAEYGKKGGERSGEVRRAKATPKQGGSTSANTETETYTEPQPDPSSSPLGEERQVTLRAVPAPEPPPTNPADARCTGHRGVTDPGPCNGCRTARERAERKLARDIDADAREAEARARDCTRCDGVRVTDDNGRPTRTRCDHRRTA
jgi:hypothetical protein